MADHHFTKGLKVEVSSDDEGFKGAWYVANIIKAPKFGKYIVKYETLVQDEESSEPLIERVHVSYIRPLSPAAADGGGCFKVNDIVDAFYRDGWWIGVVTRVFEGSGSFLITFENPPEEVEFNRSELRVHMEWVDGKWEMPQKKETKQVATLHDQSIKRSRQERRARTPHAGRYCGSAKGKKGIAMEDNVEEIVEKECIAEEFEMSPSKFMKDQEQQTAAPEIQVTDEINGSSNRLSNQKKKRGRPPKSLPEKQIGDGSISAEGVSREMVAKDCAVNKVELNAGMDHLKLMTNDDKPNEDQFQLSSNKCVKLIIGDKKLLSGLQRHNDILSIRDIPLAENDNQENEKVARKRVKRLETTVSNGQGQGSTAVDSECHIQDCQDVSKGKTSESNEMFSEKNDDKILIDGFFADVNDDQPLLMWFKGASPVGSLGQSAKAIDKKDENEITSSSIATNDSMNSSKPQKTITNDSDSGAMLARNLNQCSETSDGEGEHGTPSAAIVISDSVDNNRSLPFVKCSPIWKTIDSMEIFHKPPQKPHFSPLVNCNDDVREGLAIAQMVTFSNLMKRTSKLRFSDPRSSIERSLETLVDLELHGFDVEAVRVRLNDLLSKKDRERELQSEYKNVDNEITKSNIEKAKFEKESDEIQLKMRELAEKLVAVTSMKEMKEQEISTLGSKLDAIRKNIKSIQLDYESSC